MFTRDMIESDPNLESNLTSDILVFVGSGLYFPNSILRIAEQEAGKIHAIRVDTLRELVSLSQNKTVTMRKVFFDDLLLSDVLQQWDSLRRDMPTTDWILAYRDKAQARRMLAERARSPQLAGVLLLPMSLSVCPWTAMLRLVMAGQFIASGDLISAEDSSDTGFTAEKAASLLRNDRRDISNHRHRDSGQGHHGPDKSVAIDGEKEKKFALTRREKEVLAHVAKGGRNKHIAYKMALSEHTVKLHLHNAITKIGARNRTEAATWYLSHHSGAGHEP